MKKILGLCGVVLLMAVFLFGCGEGKNQPGNEDEITEEKIISDVEQYYQNEAFKVEQVTIVRARNDEGEQKQYIDVTLDMKSSVAEMMRAYTLEYTFYEQGGWMLDLCNPIKTGEWTAVPYDMLTVSKESMAALIFEENKLRIKSDVANVRYGQWLYKETSWYEGNELEREEYIENITYPNASETTYNYADEKTYETVAHLRASSEMLTIKEDISILWTFNPIVLEWEVVPGSKKSISNNIEATSDFCPKEFLSYDSTDAIVIRSISHDGIITAEIPEWSDGAIQWEQYKWRIMGLHIARGIKENGEFEKGSGKWESTDIKIPYKKGEIDYWAGSYYVYEGKKK